MKTELIVKEARNLHFSNWFDASKFLRIRKRREREGNGISFYTTTQIQFKSSRRVQRVFKVEAHITQIHTLHTVVYDRSNCRSQHTFPLSLSPESSLDATRHSYSIPMVGIVPAITGSSNSNTIITYFNGDVVVSCLLSSMKEIM